MKTEFRDVSLDLGYHLRPGQGLHAYELLGYRNWDKTKGLSARSKWNLKGKTMKLKSACSLKEKL